MKKEFLVSIFIVTYNRSEYLFECVNSVLESTFRDFSLYVLDNASTDNTEEIIKGISDTRITYIKHSKNIGGIANINYAMNICESKYFMIFHDDDIMDSQLIASELYELENNHNYAIVSSKAILINHDGSLMYPGKTHKFKKENKICYSSGEYLANYFKGNDGVICPSVMYRNSFFKINDLKFRDNVGQAADQFLWFEIERCGGEICVLDSPLMKYRIHENQDSNLNSIIMILDLWSALNNSEYYKVKLDKFSSSLRFRFIKLALIVGMKYNEKMLTLSEYLNSMDLLRSEFSNSTIYTLCLKVIIYVTLNFPKIFVLVFRVAKKVANLKRKL